MDILRFVNSKDIKRHLKEADYKFTPLEAAWLVYQCQDATVPGAFLSEHGIRACKRESAACWSVAFL